MIGLVLQIVFGTQITVIPYTGVERNISLTSVIFNGPVTILHDQCFSQIFKLESIDLPSTVERISNYVFYRSIKLRSIGEFIPTSIQSIGWYAFYNTAINLLKFADHNYPNLTPSSFNRNAFFGSKISSIIMPSSLASRFGITFGMNNYNDSGVWNISFYGLTSVNIYNISQGNPQPINLDYFYVTFTNTANIPIHIAKNISLSKKCACTTKSAFDKNLNAKASSKNPKNTFTVFSHPPDLGKVFIQPGNAANNVNGRAKANEKPNIPTNGPIPPIVADSTRSVPTIGPVQENETRASANAIKKIPTIPPLSDA